MDRLDVEYIVLSPKSYVEFDYHQTWLRKFFDEEDHHDRVRTSPSFCRVATIGGYELYRVGPCPGVVVSSRAARAQRTPPGCGSRRRPGSARPAPMATPRPPGTGPSRPAPDATALWVSHVARAARSSVPGSWRSRRSTAALGSARRRGSLACCVAAIVAWRARILPAASAGVVVVVAVRAPARPRRRPRRRCVARQPERRRSPASPRRRHGRAGRWALLATDRQSRRRCRRAWRLLATSDVPSRRAPGRRGSSAVGWRHRWPRSTRRSSSTSTRRGSSWPPSAATRPGPRLPAADPGRDPPAGRARADPAHVGLPGRRSRLRSSWS